MMKKKRYYFIGIGGIAMSNLAAFLKTKGHVVAGSDTDTFEPSLSLLKDAGVQRFPQHKTSNLKKFNPTVVVVGNAIGRGNTLLEFVLNENISYQSLPELIRDEVIADKKAVVITGTSGKTTTTSLVAWIFKHAGLKPSALIGGIVQNFQKGFLLGAGDYAVIEGDEYMSGFNDIRSKFFHYRPYIAAVNNIGHDHIDLFPSVSDAIASFRRFASLIPSKGELILNGHDANARSLDDIDVPVRYCNTPASLHARNISLEPAGISFDLKEGRTNRGRIRSSLMGSHNIENIICAIAIARATHIPYAKIAKAVATFKGVKRRLETIHETGDIRIIDDFGHNPVKVAASLGALRKHNPKARIICVFEPRTASSRRKVFQKQYPGAFKAADVVYIAEAFKKSLIKKSEQFSSRKLVRDIQRIGKEAYFAKSADSIIDSLKSTKTKKDMKTILVFMSSGDFGGIRQKAVRAFR